MADLADLLFRYRMVGGFVGYDQELAIDNYGQVQIQGLPNRADSERFDLETNALGELERILNRHMGNLTSVGRPAESGAAFDRIRWSFQYKDRTISGVGGISESLKPIVTVVEELVEQGSAWKAT